MCSLQVQSVISATCIWYDCWSDWDHIPTLWSMTKTEWSPSSILRDEWWGEAPHRKVSDLTTGRLREIHDWLSLSHTHLQIPLACFLLRSGSKFPRYRSGSAPAWPMEYAKSDAVQFLVQKSSYWLPLYHLECPFLGSNHSVTFTLFLYRTHALCSAPSSQPSKYQHNATHAVFLSPWDSPGKNTGVGSQSLLQEWLSIPHSETEP